MIKASKKFFCSLGLTGGKGSDKQPRKIESGIGCVMLALGILSGLAAASADDRLRAGI